MMLLTSGNRLSLSVVILLTPQDGLWSVPRMVSRLARYPCSSSKLVSSKSCISHVIKCPHVRDNGVMGLVNGRTWGDIASCVKAEHKMPPHASSVFVAL